MSGGVGWHFAQVGDGVTLIATATCAAASTTWRVTTATGWVANTATGAATLCARWLAGSRFGTANICTGTLRATGATYFPRSTGWRWGGCGTVNAAGWAWWWRWWWRRRTNAV